MLSRIWKILRDLFVDGYLVVAVAAPLLSIGFTVLKASDTFPNLRDISYAWALLPILIWVLVAYVRRDLRYITLEQQTVNLRTRIDGLAKLATLRERGVTLRNKPVSTHPEMGQWLNDKEQWLDEIYRAAGEVSPLLQARIKTLDTVGPGPKLATQGFTQEHTDSRRIISEILKRIEEFLEKNQ
jgi:hypothetical protein